MVYLHRKRLAVASESEEFAVSIICLDGEYPFFDGEVSIGQPLATIRAIFEAESCLDKARALCALSKIQMIKLFGGTKSSKWKHCKNLLRIARRFHLQAHDGTHDQCLQCQVIHAMRGEPFNQCVRVAKYEEPQAQLDEAMRVCLFG